MSASNTTAGTIATTAEPDESSKPNYSKSKSGTSIPAMYVEDKRTWRPGQRLLTQTKAQSNELKWTANDIMIAYAEKKGWVTAKAGRPDIHRAGNASESQYFIPLCLFPRFVSLDFCFWEWYAGLQTILIR
jgi:hypothetical protein